MNKHWFIEPNALKEYSLLEKKFTFLNEAQLARYETSLKSDNDEELIVVEKTALIKIRGILSNTFGRFSWMFDSNSRSYTGISREIGLAESDSRVSQIELRVDSPGGELAGLFDLLNILKSTKKPLSAVIEGQALSAAYGIVAQADRVTASNQLSGMGSIGVVNTFFVDDHLVSVSSTDAPDKRPDPQTAEGVQAIRREIDPIHLKFAEIISDGRSAAMGRSINVETVNSDFGRGGTMLATEGLTAGMIDGIMPSPERVSNSSFFGSSNSLNSGSVNNLIKNNKMDLDTLKRTSPVLYKEVFDSGFQSSNSLNYGPLNLIKNNKMDLDTLKTSHSALYKEVYDSGMNSERDRISALLKIGKSCNKMDYAITCVENGSRITQDIVQAEFLAARINKTELQIRDEDNPDDTPLPKGEGGIDVDALSKKLIADRKKRREI
jgi:ClpP class serine protease